MSNDTVPNLAKSAFRVSTLLPFWGAQQFVNFAVPSRKGVSRAAKAMQSLADAAAEGIEQPLSTISSMSEKLPAMLVDTSLKLMNPRTAADLTIDVVQRSLDAARSSVPPANVGIALTEIGNKVEVYFLVAGNNRVLGISSPPPEPFPLMELTEKSYDRGDYPALWAVEGLGHEYGNSFLQRGVDPSGLLAGDTEKELRDNGLEKSFTMLHAGIGLSFAEQLLEETTAETPVSTLRDIVKRIVRLCHENSQRGYVGAALESLGLVTRTWHSELVSTVDEILAELDDAADLRGYFWHGVGRALYFLPINFLPFSDWRVFETVRREAPAEFLDSALAGVTWAFVMVNCKDPKVVSNLLLLQHGDELAGEPGFVNGVQSSMIMRKDTTPDAEFVTQFFQHEPSVGGDEVRDYWRELVREPSERAIDDYWPRLKKQGKLGTIFKYSDLAPKPKRKAGAKKTGAESAS